MPGGGQSVLPDGAAMRWVPPPVGIALGCLVWAVIVVLLT